MSKRSRQQAKLDESSSSSSNDKRSRTERLLDNVQKQNVQLTKTNEKLATMLGDELKLAKPPFFQH